MAMGDTVRSGSGQAMIGSPSTARSEGLGSPMPFAVVSTSKAPTMRPRDIAANDLRALMAARPDPDTLPKVMAA